MFFSFLEGDSSDGYDPAVGDRIKVQSFLAKSRIGSRLQRVGAFGRKKNGTISWFRLDPPPFPHPMLDFPVAIAETL